MQGGLAGASAIVTVTAAASKGALGLRGRRLGDVIGGNGVDVLFVAAADSA